MYHPNQVRKKVIMTAQGGQLPPTAMVLLLTPSFGQTGQAPNCFMHKTWLCTKETGGVWVAAAIPKSAAVASVQQAHLLGLHLGISAPAILGIVVQILKVLIY